MPALTERLGPFSDLESERHRHFWGIWRPDPPYKTEPGSPCPPPPWPGGWCRKDMGLRSTGASPAFVRVWFLAVVLSVQGLWLCESDGHTFLSPDICYFSRTFSVALLHNSRDNGFGSPTGFKHHSVLVWPSLGYGGNVCPTLGHGGTVAPQRLSQFT